MGAHTRLVAALLLAAGQVVSEGLGLVDGLLLALGVVGVDLGRRRVTGGLATAEALALLHGDLGHLELGRRDRGHEGHGERDEAGDEQEAEHCLDSAQAGGDATPVSEGQQGTARAQHRTECAPQAESVQRGS